MAITLALVPVDTPTLLQANQIYALPSAGNQVSFQNVAGADLLLSIDGVNFASSGTASAANEVRTIFTSAAFIRCATANTWVITKVAPISVLSPPTGGGGGGGTGAALHPDGTLALPGISYTNEPDLGFYRAASGVISLTNDSVVELSVNGITHVVALNNLSAQTRVAIGAIPATIGQLRLANPSSIYARNAANTADISLLRVEGVNNDIILGYGASSIQVDSNVRFIGQAQFDIFAPQDRIAPPGPVPQGQSYMWQEDDGGGLSQLKIMFPTGPTYIIAKEGGLPIAPLSAVVSDFISVGVNPATIGGIRLANNLPIYARDLNNTANIPLIYAATDNRVNIGGSGVITEFDGLAVFNGGVNVYGPTTFDILNTSIHWVGEIGAMASAGPNSMRMWLEDKAGKTALMARFQSGNPIMLAVESQNYLFDGSYIGFGPLPATSGHIRLPTNAYIKTRQIDDLGDVTLVGSDGTDVFVGGTSQRVRIGNSLVLPEMPFATAVGNSAQIWAKDNGAGKTQLMVQFGTGAAIQIAIEP